MSPWFRFIPSGLALLGAGLLLACAVQAKTSPRSHVEQIAAAIEANYFDPERAAEIAGQLRQAAARGEFDRLADPRDLSTALTDRLKPLDRHFSVSWEPAAASAPAAGPTPTPAPAPAPRRDHGIRRVEVLPANIGYLEMKFFAGFQFGQPGQFARQAIDASLQLLAGTDALVIDLRDNGGGSPAMVGYLSSAFTAPDADIYNTFHGRDGETSEAPAEFHPSPRLDVPLYVLVSARTGSAAEAFAYTMKNAGRALVVGEATAGAANPGGPVRVGEGFRVFISDGTPISPVTGTNWEGVGVQPDVVVPAAQALLTARGMALETLLAKGLAEPAATEARWALEALRAAASPPKGVVPGQYTGSYGELSVVEAEGRLELRLGRRPAVPLQPLGDDLFTSVDDPSRRMRFERNASGAVTALEIVYAAGNSRRYPRGD